MILESQPFFPGPLRGGMRLSVRDLDPGDLNQQRSSIDRVSSLKARILTLVSQIESLIAKQNQKLREIHGFQVEVESGLLNRINQQKVAYHHLQAKLKPKLQFQSVSELAEIALRQYHSLMKESSQKSHLDSNQSSSFVHQIGSEFQASYSS